MHYSRRLLGEGLIVVGLALAYWLFRRHRRIGEGHRPMVRGFNWMLATLAGEAIATLMALGCGGTGLAMALHG